MSNKETDSYCQCLLERGNMRTVSWIPTRFATKDKYVSLRNQTGDWSTWKVLSTSEPMPAEYVEDRRDDYRHHRDFTDI
jgi:hypothetical protein